MYYNITPNSMSKKTCKRFKILLCFCESNIEQVRFKICLCFCESNIEQVRFKICLCFCESNIEQVSFRTVGMYISCLKGIERGWNWQGTYPKP